MTDHPGDQADIRWLSYSEIAAIRGISRTSAERMVRRARWRRQVDNQGVTKAAVPLAYIELGRTSPPGSQGEDPPDFKAFDAALAAVHEAKDGEIAAWRQRAEAAEARADRTGAQVTEAGERADRALALLADAETVLKAERSRADGLRDKLIGAQAELSLAQTAADRARGEAQAAQEAAEALRRAKEARKARGRWARLRAAWRGE